MERAAPIISQHGNGTNTEERDVPVVQKNFSTMDSSSQTITGTERLVDMQVSETFNIARIRQSRIRKCSHGFLRVGNRFLMVLHCLLVLISTAGAIELALLYRYTNP
jgi:hypothetical protein